MDLTETHMRTDARQEYLLTSYGTLPPDRITFGRFTAVPSARTLLRDGRPICLGARAFDLLIVLVTNRGEVVSKDDIIRFVWPTTTVDESNLRFQMGLLRKALGQDRDIIKTIPGRGYLLAGQVESDFHELNAQPVESIIQQQLLGEAISRLLSDFSRNPEAIASFEEMLTRHLAVQIIRASETRHPSAGAEPPFTAVRHGMAATRTVDLLSHNVIA